MKIRELREEELSSVVKLINQTRLNSYEFIPYTEESLLKEIERNNLKFLVATENGHLKGVIARGHRRWGERIAFLCVQPCKKQDEIEDALIQEAERLAEGERIFISIDAEELQAEKWERRGYKPEGGLYHMIAKLDKPIPVPKISEKFKLRSMKPDETEIVIKTVNTAYGWERLNSDSFREWKQRDPSFNEEWVHVAEHEGNLVSVVVSRRDIQYNSYFKAKRGYLGPAGTLQEFRGKGLASALTAKAMNFLAEKGMESVALYTSEKNSASISLLKKLGFKIRHHWKFLYKQLKPTLKPNANDKEN